MKTKTILVVEDEVIIGLNEKSILERNGYDVLLAHSGSAAVESATATDTVDLVLMDIDLGRGMDGTEAARAILQHREIPIVFLSSHTEPDVSYRKSYPGQQGASAVSDAVAVEE